MIANDLMIVKYSCDNTRIISASQINIIFLRFITSSNTRINQPLQVWLGITLEVYSNTHEVKFKPYRV